MTVLVVNHLQWTFTQKMNVVVNHVNHSQWTFTQTMNVVGCQSFTMNIHPDNGCGELFIINNGHSPRQ